MAKQHITVTATFTRPADTTAYTANDAMSDSTSAPTVLEFNFNGQQITGAARIKSVTLIKSAPGVTNADFTLMLYDMTIAALADNAAFDTSDAEAATCVGFVKFANADAEVSTLNAVWSEKNVDLAFHCANDSTTLYAAMVARGAWTPTSAEVFTFRICAEMDH